MAHIGVIPPVGLDAEMGDEVRRIELAAARDGRVVASGAGAGVVEGAYAFLGGEFVFVKVTALQEKRVLLRREPGDGVADGGARGRRGERGERDGGEQRRKQQ
jgi:hypothetical protein